MRWASQTRCSVVTVFLLIGGAAAVLLLRSEMRAQTADSLGLRQRCYPVSGSVKDPTVGSRRQQRPSANHSFVQDPGAESYPSRMQPLPHAPGIRLPEGATGGSQFIPANQSAVGESCEPYPHSQRLKNAAPVWTPAQSVGHHTYDEFQTVSGQAPGGNPRQALFRVSGPEEQTNVSSKQRIQIPLTAPGPSGKVKLGGTGGRVSLMACDAEISEILSLIAQQHGLNIVAGEGVTGRISITLSDVPLEDAFNAILTVNGYTSVRQRDIIVISRISSDTRTSPSAQGRQVRVFPLSYVAAVDVDKVVKGLMSPIGQSFITESNSLDKRRTRDLIVVEDLPEFLARVEAYIAQVDQPPRQVLIEAHVLQVDLKDETKHGVNFEQLVRIAGADVSFKTRGFANPLASPAFFLDVDGTDLDALLEALKTTTDAKTLASPKVLVLNGQEARIQIGEQLGFLVTTTTQTSTMQNVDFLDVGVVFRVTPVISADNQILMTVKPEVSSGRINPDSGLPEEETTEVETTVMLSSDRGMVIGGLIKEEDSDIQSKIPIAGDLWLIGRMFQRRKNIRDRSEIIIALVPRVVPYATDVDLREGTELSRATTRLLDGPLHRAFRPWEPQLPDAMRDPRRISFSRISHLPGHLHEAYPRPPEYYFPSVSQTGPWEHSFGEELPIVTEPEGGLNDPQPPPPSPAVQQPN